VKIMGQWFTVRCIGCDKKCLVPGYVAMRVADGLSFVMCDPCGIVHENNTGQQPIAVVVDSAA